MRTSSNPAQELASAELFERLRDLGYGDVIDLIEDDACTMKSGRINRSKLGRLLGKNAAQTEDLLSRMRIDIERLTQPKEKE